MAARERLDQQQAELGDAVAGVDAEDGAGALPVQLGDPGGVARLVGDGREVGDHAGDERLEARAPAVLAGKEDPVALNDPAEVAARRRSQRQLRPGAGERTPRIAPIASTRSSWRSTGDRLEQRPDLLGERPSRSSGGRPPRRR